MRKKQQIVKQSSKDIKVLNEPRTIRIIRRGNLNLDELRELPGIIMTDAYDGHIDSMTAQRGMQVCFLNMAVHRLAVRAAKIIEANSTSTGEST